MIVEYKNKKLKKQCENPTIAQKDFGTGIGNKLSQRIGEFISAENLSDIKALPAARIHKLEGMRNDQYAVDLVHPHRLVFKPILDDRNNIKKLELITVIRIEEVTDYHGKQKK